MNISNRIKINNSCCCKMMKLKTLIRSLRNCLLKHNFKGQLQVCLNIFWMRAAVVVACFLSFLLLIYFIWQYGMAMLSLSKMICVLKMHSVKIKIISENATRYHDQWIFSTMWQIFFFSSSFFFSIKSCSSSWEIF